MGYLPGIERSSVGIVDELQALPGGTSQKGLEERETLTQHPGRTRQASDVPHLQGFSIQC